MTSGSSLFSAVTIITIIVIAAVVLVAKHWGLSLTYLSVKFGNKDSLYSSHKPLKTGSYLPGQLDIRGLTYYEGHEPVIVATLRDDNIGIEIEKASGGTLLTVQAKEEVSKDIRKLFDKVHVAEETWLDARTKVHYRSFTQLTPVDPSETMAMILPMLRACGVGDSDMVIVSLG